MALSSKLKKKEEKLLKVVYSVARKFELHVLREAEEGQLRDCRMTSSCYDKDGKKHSQDDLDNYIRTASQVFNIVVAETKVPLSVQVTARPIGGNVTEHVLKVAQEALDFLKTMKSQGADPTPADAAPTSAEDTQAPDATPPDTTTSPPDATTSSSPDPNPFSSPKETV
ncbi:uncharacterized protein LOC62_01G001050 [Vanrija pseudolonga]|uniref:Uncharacterized protein n=1 Tax=Vanrija pseudolonga TaxID=143232 RepID=A0AAF1BF29_9TREE|nr:hypothetical protein LOC62_01G001050 [Vanrija pseudolonga]